MGVGERGKREGLINGEYEGGSEIVRERGVCD